MLPKPDVVGTYLIDPSFFRLALRGMLAFPLGKFVDLLLAGFFKPSLTDRMLALSANRHIR